MFKKSSIYLLCFVLLISFSGVFAAEEELKSIGAVMNEIRQEQGLKTNETINVSKVSPAKLEELGDSVMEAMIGNHALHEQMDRMMGGEGSASLTAMHQRIGYNYLIGYPLGMMGLMGGNMMGYPFNNANFGRGGYMMGGYGYGGYGPGMMGWFGWGGMFMGLIFLVLLVLLIVIAVRAVNGNAFRLSGSETPLDILKKRYAKGEISKEDFDRMKKDI